MSQTLTDGGSITPVIIHPPVLREVPSLYDEDDPAEALSPEDAVDDELYKYGWRYVRRIGPDGEEVLDEVPLTTEDVLHPRMGDVHLNSNLHQFLCHYFYTIFMAQLRDDPLSVVFQDVGIKWDIPRLRAISPDVSVVRGLRRRKEQWSIFKVREEGAKPALVLEITSPATRPIDLGKKKRIYALVGAPLYVIVDMASPKERRPLALLGYELTPEGYVPLQPNDRGWLWLEPVQLWIGINQKRIECYDQDENRLNSYEDMYSAYQAEAKARVDAEERAAGAEERAAGAEERAAGAEERAASAEERAATAEARAINEARTRSEVEARLREIEEELQRLKGGS